MSALQMFLHESNAIEGIRRGPTDSELNAAGEFMELDEMTSASVERVQGFFAPGKPLRAFSGMNVRVGCYIAPPGGSHVVIELIAICLAASKTSDSPWKTHVAFESLHPFMDGNGRSGRLLWAWHMQRLGRDPFALPFLHRFYYQTLEAMDRT